MVELNEKDLKLLRKLEEENHSNYEIKIVEDNEDYRYFIFIDKLLDCLDETQSYREYAEMKIKELANVIDGSE